MRMRGALPQCSIAVGHGAAPAAGARRLAVKVRFLELVPPRPLTLLCFGLPAFKILMALVESCLP